MGLDYPVCFSNPSSTPLRTTGFEIILRDIQCETKPLYRQPTANYPLRFGESGVSRVSP